MKKIFYLTVLTMVTMFTACQKEAEVGKTSTQDMAGNWWVKVSDDGGQTFSSNYYLINTYNTAANDGKQFWLDDGKNFYEIKGKVNIDVANKTFSSDNIANEYYAMTFKIADGKILNDVAKSSGTKTLTDSIYFKAEFSDDPGTKYVFSGYKKTRFLEDEH